MINPFRLMLCFPLLGRNGLPAFPIDMFKTLFRTSIRAAETDVTAVVQHGAQGRRGEIDFSKSVSSHPFHLVPIPKQRGG